MADTGHGSTIAFTSGFTAQYLSIGGSESSREALETTHLGTTTGKTFTPGDLPDNGELECEFYYDPNEQPPFNGAPQTIVITHPTPSGLTTGGQEAFTGFITNWSDPEKLTDQLMVSTFTIKVTGNITYIDAF